MTVNRLLQRHYGAALAVLTGKLGNLDLAEEALQEAVLAAMDTWPRSSPENPAAWLVTVAYRKAVDHLRREKRQLDFVLPLLAMESKPEPVEFEDSILQMIFMCCHPALAQEQQIALTLKLVMGFHLRDVARAFLVPQQTLEQRIVRAKRKIRATGIDFALPSSSRLHLRLPEVQHTLYLIFNEGYHATTGDSLFDRTLCEQAVRLMRSLCRMFRSQSGNLALLALMLFIDARSPARVADEVITLERQDRRLWKHAQIRQADVLLQKALKLGDIGPYHIQAAIAGLHSMAESFERTDWRQICLLYGKLMHYQPGPVVQLNRAVAHMMLEQWPAAESLLETIGEELRHYPPYFAAKAKLDRHQGRLESAREAIAKAAACSHNRRESAFFRAQLEQLSESI